MRAIVKTQIAGNASSAVAAFDNWQQVIEAETLYSSNMPVRSERPFIIRQLKPVQYNNQWWLQDAEKKMMLLKQDYKSIWKLLSMSGGDAMNMVVMGKEDRYAPVGLWYKNEYNIL